MAMLWMKLHKSATLQEDNLKIKLKALKYTETEKYLYNLSYSTNFSDFFSNLYSLITTYSNNFY